MCFHMLTEHCGTRITFITDFTCERLIDAMHTHVFGQLTIDVERMGAHIAFEQLIAGVNFLVSVQCRLTAAMEK